MEAKLRKEIPNDYEAKIYELSTPIKIKKENGKIKQSKYLCSTVMDDQTFIFFPPTKGNLDNMQILHQSKLSVRSALEKLGYTLI